MTKWGVCYRAKNGASDGGEDYDSKEDAVESARKWLNDPISDWADEAVVWSKDESTSTIVIRRIERVE